MPTTVRCSCGVKVMLADGVANKKQVCPLCRAVLSAPQASSADVAGAAVDIGRPGPPTESPERTELDRANETSEFVPSEAYVPSLSSQDCEPVPEESPIVHVEALDPPTSIQPSEPVFLRSPFPEAPQPELKGRRKSPKLKAKRRGLRRLDSGLSFHYASVVTYWFANVMGGATCMLWILAQSPNIADKLENPRLVFLIISSVALLLTGLLELPTTVLGMLAPAPMRRTRLIAALVLRLAACACAVGAMVDTYPNVRFTIWCMAELGFLFSWGVWLGFLNGLGRCLDRPEVADGAREIFARGLRALLCCYLLCTVVAGMLMLAIRYGLGPGLMPIPIAIAAFARMAFAVGGFDSWGEFALYPTGIPYALRYIHFIGGLRMLIARRR